MDTGLHFIDGIPVDRSTAAGKREHLQRKVEIMNVALIDVGSGSKFYALVMQGGTPGVVSKLLMQSYKSGPFDASKFFTELVINARSIDPSAHVDISSQVSRTSIRHMYEVRGATASVYPYVYYREFVGGTSKRYLYTGHLDGFAGFGEPVTQIKKYVGKVIRFDYNGGSERGVRVIRLNSVTGSGANLLLKGTDLVHNTPRSYKLNRVNGDIELVS